MKNYEDILENAIDTFEETGEFDYDAIEELVAKFLESNALVYKAGTEKVNVEKHCFTVSVEDRIVWKQNEKVTLNYFWADCNCGEESVKIDEKLEEDEQEYEGQTGYDKADGWVLAAVKNCVGHSDRYTLYICD